MKKLLWHIILRYKYNAIIHLHWKDFFKIKLPDFLKFKNLWKILYSGIILSNLLPWQPIFVLNKLFSMTSLRLWQSVINLVVQKNVLLFSPPSMTFHFLSWQWNCNFWRRQRLGHFRKIVLGSLCYWTILINICLCAKYLDSLPLQT